MGTAFQQPCTYRSTQKRVAIEEAKAFGQDCTLAYEIANINNYPANSRQGEKQGKSRDNVAQDIEWQIVILDSLASRHERALPQCKACKPVGVPLPVANRKNRDAFAAGEKPIWSLCRLLSWLLPDGGLERTVKQGEKLAVVGVAVALPLESRPSSRILHRIKSRTRNAVVILRPTPPLLSSPLP